MLDGMIYSFGPFELDLAKVELRKDGAPSPLEPQVFALLAFLVEHRERLVSRDEIFEKLWEGRIVTDSALASRVKSARRALGDDGRSQRYIKTVHGQGLRFVAEVRLQATGENAFDLTRPPGSDIVPAATQQAMSRPSIAVLPFRPLGDAGIYVTIAEGLPHELITELARLRWLFVVARNSSFRLGSNDIDPMAGKVADAREHLDLAMRFSPLDPLYYAMMSARGLTLVDDGEYAEAAYWAERGARAPGAHVLIAMIAAAIQMLAGNETAARAWAEDVWKRRPHISLRDFFSAFPMRSVVMRSRLSTALQSVGFKE